MNSLKLKNGPIHQLPLDLEKALLQHSFATNLWNDITPLARNEWICWITSAKKDETRDKRIKVALDKMRRGERRPCCWAGCPHREKTGS